MTGGSASLVDHLVDRLARRPGGPIGRLLYRHPVGHRAGFHLALRQCPVGADDAVLEVGCGGGVFLDLLLRSGCHAAAVDHSPDMLAETAARNRAAMAEGRLHLALADAAALPCRDGTFTRLFCLNAFFFFPAPGQAIAEMARVLAPGGTLAILTASPEEAGWVRRVFGPIAARMRFDTPEQLAAWAGACGLDPGATSPAPGNCTLFLAHKPSRPDAIPFPRQDTSA